jgi:hypothetical protein
VWEERPFDWWSVAEWLLVGLVFVVIAGWSVWAMVRHRERTRWMSRIG